MDPAKKIFRYRHLAEEIERKILSGIYQPGERLPSIRKLHKQSNLSISTIYHAYLELEAMGLVEARPKSGYYVNPVALQNLKIPRFKKESFPPKKVRLSSMINSVISAISNPYLLPLGSTVVDAKLMPFKHFSRILKNLSHVELKSMISYSPSEGYAELRRQIALRTVGVLEGIAPEDIIITNGCMEAVALSMLAIARPGDTIAVETPTNFGFLQLLQELGLMVMEVPADPRYGVDLDELQKIFRRNTIKACLLIPNFHNPLGALMPDDHKVRLIQLIDQYDVAVIEDDISSELHFGRKRPMPLKSYDEQDRVMTCSSFSKTLAPGLRIGWAIPGKRYMEKVQNLKAATTVSTSTLDQYLISQYLAEGAFERHSRRLRHALKKQVVRTAFAIQKHFPSATRLAMPEGGTLLWVELPSQVDGLQVYRKALDHHIAIIPGVVCSNAGQFRNFIQISCGSPFAEDMERGIIRLGEIVSDFSDTKQTAS
ncbi:MAG: PLP-dependent aminotransferase family protein [Deltaproteobacteria bacterium]|nr:PLP-dependent aminotransferase family protein [Deltaproteobacteria bacterium]